MSSDSEDESEYYYVHLHKTDIGDGEDRDWAQQLKRRYSKAGLLKEARNVGVTHLATDGNIPSHINKWAPGLTHLCMIHIPVSSVERLKCLSLLKSLVSLKIQSKVNFAYASATEYLSSLPSLTMLDLSDSKLKYVPTSLSKLHQLKVLDLSSNLFGNRGVPTIFAELLFLEELNLSNCYLVTIPFDSLSQLPGLESLNLSYNNLPPVVNVFPPTLTNLHSLNLGHCQLTDLDKSIGGLSRLKRLHLNNNLFVELPSVVCDLPKLETIDLSCNHLLKSLNEGILNMDNLAEIKLVPSASAGFKLLNFPPWEVCIEGLPSIRQYYTDLEKGSGLNLPSVTIAVIGQKMSGKTSLIQTLQSAKGERKLTNRGPDAVVDEATKVFKVEEVKVEETVLRFIDMGGHEVYHLTYQLTLRENCIPLIVVSIEQYNDLLEKMTEREAVRRLFLDWMSHLYLAWPSLGPPKLVITHKDMYTPAKFEELKSSFLETSNAVRDEIIAEEKALERKHFRQITYLSKPDTPVFSPENIHEVGDKTDDYQEFKEIKDSLHTVCMEFVKPIPRSWEIIDNELMSWSGAFIAFSKLLNTLSEKYQVTKDQLKIVLMFMHNCGKLLWYHNIDILEPFVFHNIGEVTKVLIALFRHDNCDIWDERLANFTPFVSKVGGEKITVEKAKYSEMVDKFRTTGAINHLLLRHLFMTETKFISASATAVALSLLQKFRLLHGHLKIMGENCYIIPYFTSGYQSDILYADRLLILRVDIMFNGLSLPQYVYHQMTIGLLKFFPDEKDTPVVKLNGATVYHSTFTIRLTHDCKCHKVTIALSTAAGNLSISWTLFIQIVNKTIEDTLALWTASRPVCSFYCSHCLLKGERHPNKKVNPPWCVLSEGSSNRRPPLHDGIELVVCGSDGDVPSPLKYPCSSLTAANTHVLEAYIEKEKNSSHLPDTTAVYENVTPSLDPLSTGRPVPVRWSRKRAPIPPPRRFPAATSDPHVDRQTSSPAPPTPAPRGQDSARSMSASESLTSLPVSTATADVARSYSLPIPSTAPLFPSSLRDSGEDNASDLSEEEEESNFGASSSLTSRGDDLSDVSDGEGYLYPEEDRNKIIIRMTARPTQLKRIKALFNNTDKAYKMSAPMRGRVLLINIKKFTDPSWCREGSEVDVSNLVRLFKELKFEISLHTDITAKEILETIQAESQHAHHDTYGMFALVLMSHGTEKGCVYGADEKVVELSDIYQLLSPRNFPQMVNKPKLVIVQACSGEQRDVGDGGGDLRVPSTPPEIVRPQSSSVGTQYVPRGRINHLDVDDLLIIRPSFEGYSALRHKSFGSLFIRSLVMTIYRHASHRDVYSIYKIVQRRVRELSMKLAESHPMNAYGQVVVAIDTLTSDRRLYLFPGYNGRRENLSQRQTQRII